MPAALKPAGAIATGVLYPLDEFRRLAGFGLAAMREARRKGLRVRYVGKRAFVKGDDFLTYVDAEGRETHGTGFGTTSGA